MAVSVLLCAGATPAPPDPQPSDLQPPDLPKPYLPAADVPLVDAVRRGDANAVRELLESGVEVDATTADGATALLWAVHTGQPELVALLLEAGADVDISNRYGVGPAALAAENGDAAILERLLLAGVDPNLTLRGGETLLMTAARTGDPETVRTLLAHEADPNLRETTQGQTALMWAAANNNSAALRLLTENGAEINAKTDNPSRGRGSTFSSPSPTGFSALMFAVRAGHIDATRVLLDADADVNDTVSDGESALVVAAANANWELAAYLLDRGADATHAEGGWNALHQTVRTRRMNLAFGTPGPFSSGTLDSIDLIRKLLDAGVDVNARMTRNGMRDGQRNRFNRLGATAFMLATKVTDVEAMQAWYAKAFGAIAGMRGSFQAADLPGVNLTFSGSATPVKPTRFKALDHIGFEIKDLEQFCKDLEAKGIELDGEYRYAEALSLGVAFVTDPWGTRIELTEGLGEY